jgi:hypothetical protein
MNRDSETMVRRLWHSVPGRQRTPLQPFESTALDRISSRSGEAIGLKLYRIGGRR